ncbi:MAG: AMP-binding protein, partial [bacterium]|nr:AMP-binding protein [bacterium]
MDKKNIRDIVALTPMQEGMLFHYLKEPESILYFEQLSLGLSGDVDVAKFEKAWNHLAKTNEMLRTMFRWEKMKAPVQVELIKHTIDFRYYDLPAEINTVGKKRQTPHNQHDGEPVEEIKRLQQIKIKDRQEKFDLQKVPFRVTLCKIAHRRYEAIISNHHIVYDGWSNGILLKELFQAYETLCKGKQPEQPVKTKFKEFVKTLREQELNKQAKYWKDYLAGFDTFIPFALKSTAKAAEEKKMPKRKPSIYNMRPPLKGEAVNEFVKGKKITPAAFFYTAWGILLQKYNNSSDVIFGTTISGRSAKVKGIEEMVGLFINTLPLRVASQAADKTGDLLKKINRTLQTREAYEGSPLVNIKEYSSREPGEELFDTIMVLENYPLDKALSEKKGRLTVETFTMEASTHYDLTVGINPTGGGEFEIEYAYDEESFEAETIARLAAHFRRLLERIIETPRAELMQIEILSAQEKKQLLYEFNNTNTGYPQDKTLHGIFAEQVGKKPDAICLVGPQQSKPQQSRPYQSLHISYGEVNRQANRQAQQLQTKGAGPGTIVAIKTGRSVETITAVLAILKTGAAYLPVSPENPRERIEYILADSSACILLEDEKTGHSKTAPLTKLNDQNSKEQ